MNASILTEQQINFLHGSRGLDPPPLKNDKNIGFLSKTSPDPLKITWLSMAHQQNAICMAFIWLADDDPLIVVNESTLIN